MDAKRVVAAGRFVIGSVHTYSGRLDQASVENKQALAISRLIGHVLHQSLSLRMAGQLKNWEGDYAEAVSLQSESLRIAREHNLLLPLLFGLWSYGVILTATADYDEALVMFEEGLALTEKVGDELLRLYPRLLNSLGWLYIELGNLDRALDLNRQGAERAQKRGDAEMIANAEHYVGDIFLVKGDLALGQEYFDGVYRQVKNPATSDWMKWRYSTHLYASLGELWLAKGDPAKAREFADQCLEIATPTNSRKYLVKGYWLKGEIALVRRQWDEAERWLQLRDASLSSSSFWPSVWSLTG